MIIISSHGRGTAILDVIRIQQPGAVGHQDSRSGVQERDSSYNHSQAVAYFDFALWQLHSIYHLARSGVAGIGYLMHCRDGG